MDLYAYLIFMVVAQAFSTRSTLGAGLLTIFHLMCFYLMVSVVSGEPISVLIFNTSSGLLFGIVFVITLSMGVRYTDKQRERVEHLVEELQRANGELRASQQRERELAATAERVRLAREIHDGLGHYLTVLNVQLQAAEKLIQRDTKRAEHTIAICRQQAQEALQEVRRSVAVMRQSPLDGHTLDEALAKLITEFDARSPLNAEFHMSGKPVELLTPAALTLYRTVQEGLTNAQKHGVDVHRVVVSLYYGTESTEVRVSNDGEPISQPLLEETITGGFGLAGLRERAQQLGGSFSVGPDEDGIFVLKMTLPTPSHEGETT